MIVAGWTAICCGGRRQCWTRAGRSSARAGAGGGAGEVNLCNERHNYDPEEMNLPNYAVLSKSVTGSDEDDFSCSISWPGSQREQSASAYLAPFLDPGLHRTTRALLTGPLSLKDGQVDRHSYVVFISPSLGSAIEMPGQNNPRTCFGVLIGIKTGLQRPINARDARAMLDDVGMVEFNGILKGEVLDLGAIVNRAMTGPTNRRRCALGEVNHH